MTPDTVKTDTLVCDTISRILWREKSFALADTLRDTLRSSCGFDSIYYVLNVQTEHCEPPIPPCSEMLTITADTTVCDTLMPYRWRDTLFTESARYEILLKDKRDCDSLLWILTLQTTHCPYPSVTFSADTTICDTVSEIEWRDRIFSVSSELRDTLFDTFGADSVYFVLNLSTRLCCPDIIAWTYDTLVCDTLLPFTWIIDGLTFIFEQAETQQRDVSHPKWTQCTGMNYTVSLDTIHCERLYPLIVNKYNWQLLLDNVTLRQLFPNQTARSLQWYKNEQPIPGATEDDYSEQNELHGRFQLRLELDDNRIIWSNILDINIEHAEVEQLVHVRIFNSHGIPVREDQLTRGIYLYRYEKGDTIWTEKRLVP